MGHSGPYQESESRSITEHCRGLSRPAEMAGLRLATFLRFFSSDKVELGVHLARLPASPLLTELVLNWLPGEVTIMIMIMIGPSEALKRPCHFRHDLLAVRMTGLCPCPWPAAWTTRC